MRSVELLFAYTARKARDHGLDDVAEALERAEIPEIDGGGIRLLSVARYGGPAVVSREYQRIPEEIGPFEMAKGATHVSVIATLAYLPIDREVVVENRLRLRLENIPARRQTAGSNERKER